MAKDLAKWAKDKGVKYFMVSYTDLFGGQRAKLVPTAAINDMAVDGAGFAGFATWLDLTPAHPDMMAVPDPESAIQLPWKKEVAWLASNCVMEEQPVAQAPRNVLRKLIDEAAKEGLRVKTGVEPEFFLLTPEGDRVADPYDNAEKPCYDQQAVMRRYDVISEICDYMLELGWEAYQNDHEDANGQFEMNWKYDDALATAALRFSDEVDQVVILTPDKDLAQCVVGDRVVMFDRRREIVIDEEGVWKKFGVGPESIPDYLGLVGDTAHGFPGVPSWGAKSASTLLAQYVHLDRIPPDAFDCDDKVRGADRLALNLRQHRKEADLYRHLATLRRDVPLQETLEDLEWQGADRASFIELCDEFGFNDVRNRPHRWVE